MADEARALTADGKERLERASKGWQRVVGRVDKVLVSPLLRARQTAAIFGRAVGKDAVHEEAVELVPMAPPLRALERLQVELLAGAEGVACVGHEPNLGSLLGLLLTGSDRTVIRFKKGMLAAAEIESAANMLGRLVLALSQRIAGGL